MIADGKLRHDGDPGRVQREQDLQPLMRRDGHLPGGGRAHHAHRVNTTNPDYR